MKDMDACCMEVRRLHLEEMDARRMEVCRMDMEEMDARCMEVARRMEVRMEHMEDDMAVVTNMEEK